MAQIIEPYRQEKKLTAYLTEEVKRVGIVYFHGLGDCIQFIHLFDWLKTTYPNIHFDILLQGHLGQELIFPDGVPLTTLDGLDKLDYDYVFLVHFPVEIDGMTKAELCCETELGCPKMWEYGQIPSFPRYIGSFKMKNPNFRIQNKLIGVHFQNTALPGVFNPTKEIAEKVWNEILEAGGIPIELDFQHPYHNPVNEKFDFVDCTVRRVKPTVQTLLELLTSCAGFVGVPSGPLHCALATIPDRVFYLEKGVPIQRFTYWNIPSVNVNDYKEGAIKTWVNTLLS